MKKTLTALVATWLGVCAAESTVKWTLAGGTAYHNSDLQTFVLDVSDVRPYYVSSEEISHYAYGGGIFNAKGSASGTITVLGNPGETVSLTFIVAGTIEGTEVWYNAGDVEVTLSDVSIPLASVDARNLLPDPSSVAGWNLFEGPALPAPLNYHLVEGFYYENVSNGVVIVATDRSEGKELIIPSSLDGKPVVGLRNDTEFNYSWCVGPSSVPICSQDIESLIIPDSVRSIGAYSFNYCPMLTNVVIGSGVTNVGVEAFTACYALTSVLWKGNKPSCEDEDSVFDSYTSLVNYVQSGATGWGETFGGRPVVVLGGSVSEAPKHTVMFDVGNHGTRTGGGELTQTVEEGSAAVTPEVTPNVGYEFKGWDKLFASVTNDLTVTAQYRRTGVNLMFYVDATSGNDGNAGMGAATAFRSIQAAIDAAIDGDEIIVADGTYAPINSYGKRITIRSVNGSEKTIIDAALVTNRVRCATLSSIKNGVCVDGNNTVLRGFTLTHGWVAGMDDDGYPGGGGVRGGILYDCVIRNNQVFLMDDNMFGGGCGGGAYESELHGCLIEGNLAKYGQGGGAAGCPLIEDCVIRWNVAEDGDGGGVWGGTLNRCVLQENSAEPDGGGGDVYCADELNNCLVISDTVSLMSVRLYNSTIVATSGFELYGAEFYNSIVSCLSTNFSTESFTEDTRWVISCNSCMPILIEGEDGERFTSSIVADPKFVDAATGDYRLRADSPCINAGTNRYVYGETDLAGNPRIVAGSVDMGAYEFQGEPLPPVVNYAVTFDVGEHGERTGGGALTQMVEEGSAAVAPEVMPNVGYEFDGWDCDFSAVMTNLTVTAQYRDVRIDLVPESVAAPTAAAAGEETEFVWTVANRGARAATISWTEAVYLTDGTTEILVASVVADESLAAVATVSRCVRTQLPKQLGISGTVQVRVVVDSANAVTESVEDNNSALSAAFDLPAKYWLDMASNALAENSRTRIRCVATRSDNRAAEDVPVTIVGAGLSAPQTVSFARGAFSTTFYISAEDDSIYTGTREVSVSVGGSSSVGVTVSDNEKPSLLLELPEVLVEGETAVCSVTREGDTATALVVGLGGISTAQCAYPVSVTIPAGEESAEFELTAVNDTTAEIDTALTLRASAAGYNTTSAAVLLKDDDVPGVTLTIAPEELSEGAGAMAAYAILSRVDQRDIASPLTVRLSVSEPDQLIVPATVTIPKYTMAVRFAVGTVDNAEVDGDREVSITGAVVIPSCNCSAQPSSGDAIRVDVLITDNDGPTLSVSAEPASMMERREVAGYLVVSHNTTLTEDLEVTISHDSPTEVAVQEMVVIPAGAKSVRVPVKTLDDGEEDGSQVVAVYVDAEGYTSGSGWFLVCDQNIPDLAVTMVTPESVAAVAGAGLQVEYTISNIGFNDRAEPFEYEVHLLRGNGRPLPQDSTCVFRAMTPAGLSVGESFTFTTTVAMPTTVGDYRIAVCADRGNEIIEVNDLNNTLYSEVIAVNPSYLPQVRVADSRDYLQGETVRLVGEALLVDGVTAAANVEVSVIVTVNGMRRTLTARTDASGAFAVDFTPIASEAGDYTVCACYPGVVSAAVQDTFKILGMKLASGSSTWNMTVEDERSGTLRVQNLSSVPLTGLTVHAEGAPDGCAFAATIAETLSGKAYADIAYTVTATAVTDGTNYKPFTIVVESAEGARLAVPAYFYAQSKKATIKVNPTALNTTMTVGSERYVEFTLTNIGKGDSGRVEVQVPSLDWLRVVGGAVIDNIPSGGSATVTVELAPKTGIKLNAPFTGRFAVTVENGAGVNIPFTFTAVTESTGSLLVDVTDEYTYYEQNAPHVADANVIVKNFYTGAVVARGTTGTSGTWLSGELPEGRYNVSVEAQQHTQTTVTVDVDPGVEKRVEIFSAFKAISYSWNVERIEIEDQYTVTLLADFVVNVPKPVIIIDVPKSVPDLAEGESCVINVTLQNKGLIAARNVRLGFPKDLPYDWEVLVTDIGDVPALSSLEIPVKLTNPVKTAKSGGIQLFAVEDITPPDATTQFTPCSYAIMAMFEYLCGPDIRQDVARSGNIQFWGKVCDILAVMVNVIADNFHWTGGGNVGPGSPVPLPPEPQPPVVVDPPDPGVVLENCRRGLAIINTTLGWLPSPPCSETIGVVGARFQYREYVDTNAVVSSIVDCMFGSIVDKLGDSFEIVKKLAKAQEIEQVFNVFTDYREKVKNYLAEHHPEVYSRLEKLGEQKGIDLLVALVSGNVGDYVSKQPAVRFLLNSVDQSVRKIFEAARDFSHKRLNVGVRSFDGTLEEDNPLVVNDIPESLIEPLAGVANYLEYRDTETRREAYILGNGVWDEEPNVGVMYDMLMVAAREKSTQKIDESDAESLMRLEPVFKVATADDIAAVVARWNRTAEYWASGIYTAADVPSGDSTDFADCSVLVDYHERLSDCVKYAVDRGYDDPLSLYTASVTELRKAVSENEDGVCAKVTMKLEQTVAVTREAFLGTLKLFNGHNRIEMKDVRLELKVFNTDNINCNHLFGIIQNDLSGFSGGSIIDGGLTLAANSEGIAKIQFTPTIDAAKEDGTLYYFGGTLHYINPFTGQEVSVELTPNALIVNPTPILNLHYFLQREVYGDDPMTPDVVEPSQPAELALLMVNRGYGTAKSVRVHSAQPEKFIDEKGLAVDFKLSNFTLDASLVNGVADNGLKDVSLGDIGPGATAQAQWWLTSSLQGHFENVKASFTQVNDWGNRNTSLIEDVKIHRLVRSIVADTDGLGDFLITENDPNALPDTIYMSSGDCLPVANDATVGTVGALSGANPAIRLRVTPTTGGWNYARFDDPSDGRYEIVSVLREDGSAVPERNVWTTDRTFRDGRSTLMENKIHLVDEFPGGLPAEYTVTFSAKETVGPSVVAITGVEDGGFVQSAISELMVEFDSAVDPATFTVEDLVLLRQGEAVTPLDGVTVTLVDDGNRLFVVRGLAAQTGAEGTYVFRVVASGVTDTAGTPGLNGLQTVWTKKSPVAPAIMSIRGIEPGAMVNTVGELTVVTTVAVVPSSFSRAAVKVNGEPCGSSVSVTAADGSGTKFTVSGLDDAIRDDGAYTVGIDASVLRSADGCVSGVGMASVTFEVDRTPPQLYAMEAEDALYGRAWIVHFSEAVVSETFGAGNARLLRDNATVAADGLTVAMIDATTFRIALPDTACEVDGSYRLIVSAAGARDAAGNVATGIASDNWTVDRTPPTRIADLRITPDLGESDSDGITAGQSFTLTGTAGESPLAFEALLKSGSSEVPLAAGTLSGTELAVPITLPSGGNATLTVRLTDASGNSSDSEISIFADVIELKAAFEGIPTDINETAENGIAVVFSDRIAADGVGLDRFVMSCDGLPISLTGASLEWLDDKTLRLTGIEEATNHEGRHRLVFTLEGITKKLSGLAASGVIAAEWDHVPPDKVPPEIVELLIDGEPVRGEYTNGFSRVEMTFSEAVNVAELIDSRMITEAVGLALYGAEQTMTGRVASVASDFVFDANENRLIWNLRDPVIPVGGLRLFVDGLMVTDKAGNGVVSGAAETTSGDGWILAKDTPVELCAATSYAVPSLVDINGDGRVDVLVGEKTADGRGKVRVYLNDGAGQFSAWNYLQVNDADLEIAASGCQGVSVCIGDVTGDGFADIVVGAANGDVLLYRAKGTGGYCEASMIHSVGSRAVVSCCDGDVLVGAIDGTCVRLSLSGDGALVEATTLRAVNGTSFKVAAGRSTPVVAAVRPNGQKLLFSGDTEGSVWAYALTWNGAVVPTGLQLVKAGDVDRSRVTVGDLNGDGVADVVVGRADGKVQVYYGEMSSVPVVDCEVVTTVEATAGAHGAVSPEGVTVFHAGDEIRYTFTPDPGYAVEDVLVNGESIGAVDEYAVKDIATSATVSATFKAVVYSITYQDTKGADNSANPLTYTVESEEVIFAALADTADWHFVGWSPNGIAAGSTGDRTVTAQWRKIHTVKFDLGEHGTLADGDLEQRVIDGDDAISPVVTAAEGYEFVGWDAEFSSVTGDITLTAQYRAIVYEIVYEDLRGADNSANPATYTVEDEVNLVPLANVDDWRFVGWSPDKIPAGLTGDMTVTAQWEKITLVDALDASELVWTTGGAAEWKGQTATTSDGDDAAVSGVIGDSQNSWIVTTVEGAGTLTFKWRVSCEERYDALNFMVDGAVKARISGETDWQTHEIELKDGVHTLRWMYMKGRSGSAGEDRAWLDSVEWKPLPPLTIGEAVNAPDLDWPTSGDAGWTASRDEAYDNEGCAISGAIGDRQLSRLETTVVGPGQLTFMWKVSSEEWYDWLDFLVDGQLAGSITGEQDWQMVTLYLDEGRHQLTWEYWKDELDDPGMTGFDRAWLDCVIWEPDMPSSGDVNNPAGVFIPYSWFEEYGMMDGETDYVKVATSKGANNVPVWQCYVAGLDPTDETSKFTASIELVDGKPVVTWDPDLNANADGSRTPGLRRDYIIKAKRELEDEKWDEFREDETIPDDYHFFQIEVLMSK